MKKNDKKTKIVISLCLVIAICFSNFCISEAAKKIKSKSVAIGTDELTMAVGDVIILDGYMKPANSTDSLKWTSSNKKVATVNKYGVVTAKTEGTVTITVKTSSKKKDSCKITIKKYLTEKEIKALIASNCLQEEEVLKLIKDNSLSEETVKSLIKTNSISEETVKKLVKDNSLSEEDVKRIVQENSCSGSCGIANWEDGTSVVVDMKFPMTDTIEKCECGNNAITILSMDLKKYHAAEEELAPYSYELTMQVKADESLKEKQHDIFMGYIDAYGNGGYLWIYDFTREENNESAKVMWGEDGIITYTWKFSLGYDVVKVKYGSLDANCMEG